MIRAATTLVVVVLAAVAAVVSYRHAFEVVTAYGEAGFTAYLSPLTVDGAIFASSMVMLDAARRGLPVPSLARWTLALGILATLAANVAHGWAHGPVGAIVAAWPAVALVLSYELLMGLIRRGAAPAGKKAVDEPLVEALQPIERPALRDIPGPVPADPVEEAWRDVVPLFAGMRPAAGTVPAVLVAEPEPEGEPAVSVSPSLENTPSEGVLVSVLGDGTTKRWRDLLQAPGETHPASGTGTAPAAAGYAAYILAEPVAPPAQTPILAPVPDELFPVAAARYAEQLAEGQVPALTRIKKELRVGQPRAARIRTYLGQLAQA
ncbi:hypothetical protein Ppa06_26210 [Planomonospora parontospora subsp. parontospora]|uniref:DUF2637 domain-containing protein n=2 Tax=Planomonospora parontospora TaxID=58119 RepID=A0AA37BEQ4_9ACTN|nr:DUF2637 domain-containing protein [Planomonospora parontospora]GGK60040.1 hypothetical protein GCM10010126_19470 [Planomonospora parontospora]GII08823.1 hypothetical protein Ppa06_26210 [Planomonospora parontospora subsp. parontospora]